MKINHIQSALSFGKQMVAICELKKDGEERRTPATLYKLEAGNPDDSKEIKTLLYDLKYRQFIKDFNKSTHRSGRDFYVLSADDTAETIGAIETYRVLYHNEKNEKRNGVNVVISELPVNKKYASPELPLLAQVAKEAKDRGDVSVVTAFREEDNPDLDNKKFSLTKNDVWYLPAKRYDALLKQASKKTYIQYDGDN